MAELKTKSALLAGAFAVLVMPAQAQETVPDADADPMIEQPMPGADAMGAPGVVEPMDPAAGAVADGAVEPAQEPQQAAPGLDAASVRALQEALSQAGHDAGPADGIWGPRSRDAMTSFQAAQGIEPTGLINLRSIEALGLADLAAALAGQVGPGEMSGGAAGSAPIATDPVVTEPVVTEPLATDPVITEPMPTDPVITEPMGTGTIDPGTPAPGTMDAEQPAADMPAEPGTGEPGSVVPEPGEPGAVPSQ